MSKFAPNIPSREGMDPTPLSAFSRALFIVKDEPSLQKYVDRFEKEKLEIYSRANLQNVILFSGAILDACIIRNKEKSQKYVKYAIDVEQDIYFSINNYNIAKAVLLDLVNDVLVRERNKGFEMQEFLTEAYRYCKNYAYSLYQEYIAS